VASAREHIPLNTSVGSTAESSHIPDPGNRQPIDRVVNDIFEQTWYLDQIKYRRIFGAKAGSLGRRCENPLCCILAKCSDTRPASFRPYHDGVARRPRNNNTIFSSDKCDSCAVSRERRHCLYKYGLRQISDLSGKVHYNIIACDLTRVRFLQKVPFLRMLEQDKGAKAIFIYPTKVGLRFIRDFGRG
jgi:hypothetical protein